MGSEGAAARRGGRPFRLLTAAQACGLDCRQEVLVTSGDGGKESEMDGIGFGTLGLGIATEHVVPVAIGGGMTAALTVAGRLAAPVGSQLHRHAPAAAGAAAAIFTGLVTKSGAGALAALLVGGLIWGSERLLEFQAQRLLPAGGR